MTSAKFQGNTIGLAVDGVTPLPNGGAGIFLDGVSDGGRIGGTSPGAGNVISGNLGTGVLIGSSDGWRLEGNRIGVTAAGTALAPQRRIASHRRQQRLRHDRRHGRDRAQRHLRRQLQRRHHPRLGHG